MNESFEPSKAVRVFAVFALAFLSNCGLGGAQWKVTDPNQPESGGDYYITGRYFCVDESDGSSRGSCDLHTRAKSCAEAIAVQRTLVAQKGDVCKRCSDQIFDNTKRFNGKVDWIHGGPCQNQHP